MQKENHRISPRFASWLILAASLLLSVHAAHAQSQIEGSLLGGGCRNPPAIDPTKDFIGNFNNSCYALPLVASRGANKAGDLNAIYALGYYTVTPGYELVLTGTYPNARFFSVTVYDSHAAVTSDDYDVQIQPLNSSNFNPFLTTAPYQPNQQYGITVGFGGSVPTDVSPGCSTSDTTIDQNFLDASQIHQGITWNGYPDLPNGFPVHQTGANDAGAIIVRNYYELATISPPVLIVRQLSNGCAVPLSQAGNIITTSNSGAKWSNSSQISSHDQFAYQIDPVVCYPPDPTNQVVWVRSANYVPGDNGAASYLYFALGSTQLKSLMKGGQFIRMQFQLPAMPNIPCANGGCGLTGNEQLRYRSISFENSKTTTYASVMDVNMVRDANGNVTLIFGVGTKPPSYVTAQNGYTYVDLSKISGYKNIANIAMRDILPNAAFDCSAANVPFNTSEYNPAGGYMGNYVPTVDFPTGAEIPATPVPPNRPNSCSAVVTQQPAACGSENQY